MKIVANRCLLAVSMMNLLACGGFQKKQEGTIIVDKKETPVTEVVEAPSSTPISTDTPNAVDSRDTANSTDSRDTANSTDSRDTANSTDSRETANSTDSRETTNSTDSADVDSINPLQPTTTPLPTETSFDASIAQATVDQIMATKKTVLKKDFTGYNVKPFNKDKYQIFAFLGCSTLSYYNYSYFDFKKTSEDPDGHNNLDIVTTTVENDTKKGSAQVQALLGPILGGEDISWQNIVAQMDQPSGDHRAMIGVSGDQPLNPK